jgi:hypothetical protein
VYRWFIPEVEDPSDITNQERDFASALSEATSALVRPGEHTHDLLIPAAYADHGQNTLVARLGISDWLAERPIISLLDFGVHFSGAQGAWWPTAQPALPPLGRDTQPLTRCPRRRDSLAAKTAAWFEAVLSRPIVLHVWMHEGRGYASGYEFADTHETLVQAYDRPAAPQDQY